MIIKKLTVSALMAIVAFGAFTHQAHAAVNRAVTFQYLFDGTNLSAETAFVDTASNTTNDISLSPLPLASTTDSVTMAAVTRQAAMDYAAVQGYTITQYVDLTNPTATAWVFNYPSLAVNTARQASATRVATVSASVDITASLSLITGQTGKVSLQYADDSGFMTNVKTAQSATNGNTGSLTLGLNLGQIVTATVTGDIPAGKYYRLLTTNITGTPTYGTPVIQEVIK